MALVQMRVDGGEPQRNLERALGQIAAAAAQGADIALLPERDLSRLHKCRHERCVLFFYGTTKSGTRQWCSLECMSRARSSANYLKRKAARQDRA